MTYSKVLLLLSLSFYFMCGAAEEYAPARLSPSPIGEGELFLSGDEEVSNIEIRSKMAILRHYHRKLRFRARRQSDSGQRTRSVSAAVVRSASPSVVGDEEKKENISAVVNSSASQEKAVNCPVAFRRLFSCVCCSNVDAEEDE